MRKFKKYLLFLLALSSAYLIKAQDGSVEYFPLPLKITFGNHAVGFPYQNSFTSFNSHFSLGTELGINQNQKHHLFVSPNVGFFRNKFKNHGIHQGINTNCLINSIYGIVYRRKHNNRHTRH